MKVVAEIRCSVLHNLIESREFVSTEVATRVGREMLDGSQHFIPNYLVVRVIGNNGYNKIHYHSNYDG